MRPHTHTVAHLFMLLADDDERDAVIEVVPGNRAHVAVVPNYGSCEVCRHDTPLPTAPPPPEGPSNFAFERQIARIAQLALGHPLGRRHEGFGKHRGSQPHSTPPPMYALLNIEYLGLMEWGSIDSHFRHVVQNHVDPLPNFSAQFAPCVLVIIADTEEGSHTITVRTSLSEAWSLDLVSDVIRLDGGGGGGGERDT